MPASRTKTRISPGSFIKGWHIISKNEDWRNETFIFDNRQNGEKENTKVRDFNLGYFSDRIWFYFSENDTIIIEINTTQKSH